MATPQRSVPMISKARKPLFSHFRVSKSFLMCISLSMLDERDSLSLLVLLKHLLLFCKTKHQNNLSRRSCNCGVQNLCVYFFFSYFAVCVCESFFCLANRFHIDIFFSKKSRFPSIWVHAEHILHCCLDLVCFGFFSRLFLSVNIIIVCITWCFIYYFMQAKCNEIHSHNGYPTLYLIPLSLSRYPVCTSSRRFFVVLSHF